jgi:hypothetical protein
VEYLFILFKGGVVDLDGIGILGQTHERGEGVAIPEIEGVEPVVDHGVEVFGPKGLVIEPGEVLRRIWIFVRSATGEEGWFLETDAGTAEDHAGVVGKLKISVGIAMGLYPVGEVETAVEDARGVGAGDMDVIAIDPDGIAFFLFDGGVDGNSDAAAPSGGRSKALFTKIYTWLCVTQEVRQT